jgi:hypothetical protein
MRGYVDGTASYESDRGMVFGYNRIPYTYLEKKLTSVRPFAEHRGKAKFCAHCGNVATQEALFEVDEISLIERYCEICVKKIK